MPIDLQKAKREAIQAGDFENAYRIEQEMKKQAAPVDFSAGRMVSNIPSSAVRYGKNIVSTILHPVDTAEAIGGLAQSVGNKIGRNVAELVHGQEMEPMPERSEAVANAVGNAYKGRYGSVDAAKTTLMEDPIGMLADVAGVMAATKIPGVSKVGAAMEPVNLAAKTARTIAKAAIPKGAARKLYESAAKFSTTLSPSKRAAVVDTALEYGIMPTSKGVIQVSDRIDILNSQLDDLVIDATVRGAKIPVNAVFQHLKALRRTKGGIKLEAADDLKAIDRIAGQFHQHVKGKQYLTPEELQAFKVDAYQKIAWDAKRMAGSPIKEDVYKAVARGAKDAIVNAAPETAGVNRQLGALYELQPHLQRAANRIDNRNLLSINAPLNVGAGGIVGQVTGSGSAGVAAGAIGAALGNPKMKARIALAANKIKQGDIGWLEANIHTAEVRIALALSGRLEDEVSDQQATQ